MSCCEEQAVDAADRSSNIYDKCGSVGNTVLACRPVCHPPGGHDLRNLSRTLGELDEKEPLERLETTEIVWNCQV